MKKTLSASLKKLSIKNLSPGINLQKIANQNRINQSTRRMSPRRMSPKLLSPKPLSPKRSTLRRPRIVRGNESASLAQIAKNKADKLEQARASLAAATAAKKAVYKQYSLTNSNNNQNSNNKNSGPNSLEQMYIYNDTRVPFLKEALTKMGILGKSIPKSSTKPILYRAFINETRKRRQLQ
jgi:hypothetical protein